VATDPTDLLATGIEIEARPGRKRVKRISLLSGGERALTALAFLFAIFKARPSPFYLMDEVEPALDDVNLHRFISLVEGFAGDAQVLIVTHQKRTMEMAEVMYGVSMSKDGTSKVVAQRLEHPATGNGHRAGSGDVVTIPEPDAVR
jgi:chromosome segregation protein